MANPGNDDDIDAEVAALRAAFVARLGARLEALIAVRTRLEAPADAAARKLAMAELETLAHGIAGSAGLFGFADLAACAERVETACAERVETACAERVETSCAEPGDQGDGVVGIAIQRHLEPLIVALRRLA